MKESFCSTQFTPKPFVNSGAKQMTSPWICCSRKPDDSIIDCVHGLGMFSACLLKSALSEHSFFSEWTDNPSSLCEKESFLHPAPDS